MSLTLRIVSYRTNQQNALLLKYNFNFYDVQPSYTAACKQIMPYLCVQLSYTIACR